MANWTTEATTSTADFISKLYTFLTTGGPGWNADHHAAGSGEMAVSKSDGGGHDVEVAFQWDTGTPDYIGIYQYRSGSGAGNYNNGVAPYQQANDSGNGAASASRSNILASRSFYASATPLRYWCFTGSTYAHVVVNYAAEKYSHFGFGVLDKFNDWTGGEYCYGHRWETNFSSNQAVKEGATLLLDGYSVDAGAPQPTAMEGYVATVRAQNFVNGPTSHMYAVVMGNQGASDLGNDRQATPRGRLHFAGGARAGIASTFGNFRHSGSAGFVPGYPIMVAHWDRTGDEAHGPLGVMKDVRCLNMENYAAQDTITVSGSTWHIFPAHWKIGGTTLGASLNSGVMYKQN